MKYRLILSLLIAIGIQFAAHSQSSPDTACLPISDLLKVLQAGKEGKAYKDLNELLKTDTATLGGRIRQLQRADGSLINITDSYKRDSALYNQIIDLHKKQTKVAEDEAAAWKKEYTKEKRKRFWTGVSGAVLTVAAILIKK